MRHLRNDTVLILDGEVRVYRRERSKRWQAAFSIDGAQYLTGGGTFSKLDNLSEQDWEQMKAMIRSSNNKDKANRN